MNKLTNNPSGFYGNLTFARNFVPNFIVLYKKSLYIDIYLYILSLQWILEILFK